MKVTPEIQRHFMERVPMRGIEEIVYLSLTAQPPIFEGNIFIFKTLI